jgi:hypothetical protein
MGSEQRRAGRFETLGAWLHIWTPARDVEVPPVPWRRLVLVGVPVLAVVVGGTWLVIDDASESRREREAAAERAAARRAATQRRRLLVEQAVRRERVAPAPKPVLVAALEEAIFDDARRRVRRGELAKRVQRVDCEPHPRTAPRRAAERDPSARSGRYHCLAVNRDLVGIGEGSIGYPFLARIRYRTGRLVWCKVNPVPGEQAVPDPRGVAELPPACT